MRLKSKAQKTTRRDEKAEIEVQLQRTSDWMKGKSEGRKNKAVFTSSVALHIITTRV